MAVRTAADGVGAREWLEMGGEKKPLGMNELGCADLRTANRWGEEAAGDQRSASLPARTAADGGCKGVAGNGLGEEAAGDERAWLRGRLRTAWVQGVAEI